MPTTPAIRDKRRQAILDILGSGAIARQSELVRQLNAQGIEATQSSVSRDFRELGIVKLDNGYGRVERNATSSTSNDIPVELVRDIQTAGSSLTVIKTAIGAAQRVALFIDRSEWPEIVGTVSGDDTIFVATRNGHDQNTLLGRLRSTLPG